MSYAIDIPIINRLMSLFNIKLLPDRPKPITADQAEDLIQRMKQLRNNFQHGGFVTWDQMNEIPVAQSPADGYELTPGVTSYRLELPAPFLLFEVVMSANTSFGFHGHNCPEYCWIMDGSATVNGIDRLPFNFCYFGEGEYHTFSSVTGCRLFVAFPKPGDSE